MLKTIIRKYRNSAREKRRAVFTENFKITKDTKILDVGSETGANINFILQNQSYSPKNIYIADINENFIEIGKNKYGYTPVLVSENGLFPFEDNFFDIVYCSSVIEHVTISKKKVWSISDNKKLKELSQYAQNHFSSELRRVGASYFVQTPNKWFVVESHSWLPFVGWFSRPIQIRLIRLTNTFWIKKTVPDFHLLSQTEFQKLFPESNIIAERSCLMAKSWMAIQANILNP